MNLNQLIEDEAEKYSPTDAIGDERCAFKAGTQFIIKHLSEKEIGFDEKAVTWLSKMKAPNAHCPLNEVDSDIDHYSDLGKDEGIMIGARWQFNSMKAMLAVRDARILELTEALVKIATFGEGHGTQATIAYKALDASKGDG